MNRTQQANKNVSVLAGVIVMAVFAVGLGYLLGTWVINALTGDPFDPVTTDPAGSQVVVSDPGTAQITLPTVEVPQTNYTPNTQQQQSGLFIVQVGAFNSYTNAERLCNELKAKGYTNVKVTDGPPYKVQLKAVQTRTEADNLKSQAKKDGYVDVFIVH